MTAQDDEPLSAAARAEAWVSDVREVELAVRNPSYGDSRIGADPQPFCGEGPDRLLCNHDICPRSLLMAALAAPVTDLEKVK
jgi:hypothetical protein